MKRQRKVGILLMALVFLVCYGTIFFGMGFEFGTGLPMVTLLTSHDNDITLPEDMTIKTTTEARQVVEEAVEGNDYEVGYTCLDYAWDAMRALNWDGQPSAVVKLTYEDGTAHALVLTATKDGSTKKWMFLDPRTGIEVYPVPGGYWGGHKIVSVKIMVPHWVDFEEFAKNPNIVEVEE